MAPRSREERKSDTLAKLASPGLDAWVATASPAGGAHLVPLSWAWDGDRVILATERRSKTLANIESSGRARIGLGPERDVVMIDAVLVSVIEAERVPRAIAEAFADQADWDPRQAGPGYVYAVLAPERIMAWREADEIAGRTLLDRGTWLV